MESELQRGGEGIEMLRTEVKRLSFQEESFQGDDKKVAFFTGLPSLTVLNLILCQITNALDKVKVKNHTNFQKLVLCLMKMRNNVTFRGLSYRFNI